MASASAIIVILAVICGFGADLGETCYPMPKNGERFGHRNLTRLDGAAFCTSMLDDLLHDDEATTLGRCVISCDDNPNCTYLLFQGHKPIKDLKLDVDDWNLWPRTKGACYQFTCAEITVWRSRDADDTAVITFFKDVVKFPEGTLIADISADGEKRVRIDGDGFGPPQ